MQTVPSLSLYSFQPAARERMLSMRIDLRPLISVAVALSVLLLPGALAAAPQNQAHQRNEKKLQENLVKEVRHQLLLLPYYSVFDNLLFKVDGDKVTLFGQVVRPTLKSDAENVVKGIEG